MKKHKYFIDFTKEEKWLEDMAKQGYKLVKASTFCYKFKKAEKENTTIKIDYRQFKNKDDFNEYVELFKDTGWIHIEGNYKSRTQYFEKSEEAGSDDIFSDNDSRANRYKEMHEIFVSLAVCFMPIFAALIMTDSIDVSALFNPTELFYTPGLWEMNGGEFWRKFLFELPIALFRGLAWLALPLMIIGYFTASIKANKLYKELKD